MKFDKAPKRLDELENKEERKILDGAATVVFLGKDETLPDIGWSLRHMKKAGDELLPQNQLIVKMLKEVAAKNGIHTFLAPVAVPQNGILEEETTFTDEIDLGDGVTIKRGSNNEGVLLGDGEAFVVSPADCLTVVAQSDKGLIATHAGRESLFDANNPHRNGVIENIIKILGENSKIWAGFGIGPDNFLHEKNNPDLKPEHRELNRLREYLLFKKIAHVGIKDERINLYDILLELVEKAGGLRENVTLDKTVDTYTQINKQTGEHTNFSRRRESGSNLAIVFKN